MAHYEYDYDSDRQTLRLSNALGWFSIGLGLAELLAPKPLARMIGVADNDTTDSILRACGARELGTGLAILAEPDRARWLWGRVGGDALDLALLGSAMSSDASDRSRGMAAALAVAAVTALDVLAAQRLSAGERRPEAAAGRRGAVRVEQAVTINRSIDQVYDFWRDFQNLPRFMRHLDAVTIIDERRSRWRAKAPAGMTVEWEAEMLEDRPGEWIAWRSIEGSQIENSGSVRFQPAPGARGTELRVQLQYSPPAGRIGRGIAWLFGEEPEQQLYDDLRRFKQLMETGEIPISDGPGMWRAAQPASRPDKLKSLAGVRE
jgi:uncharacterized membrane protein